MNLQNLEGRIIKLEKDLFVQNQINSKAINNIETILQTLVKITERIRVLESGQEIQMRLNDSVEKALKSQVELMDSLTKRMDTQSKEINHLYKRTNDLLNLKL